VSCYDDEFDDDAFETPIVDEPGSVPEDMKLTVEVGLSRYSPGEMLNLLAQGILRDIGGRDHWKKLLAAYLLRLGKDRAEDLVAAEVERIFAAGVAGLDFTALVREAAEGWANEKVRYDGRPPDAYERSSAIGRLEWFAKKLVKEAMDAAWKEAEAEWKAKTQAAIKATLTEAMADRLAKALPTPAELRS
jgi:hypothetical protein